MAFLRIFFGVLLSLLVLSGCHPAPRTTLRLALWIPNEEMVSLKKQVDEFESENPSCRVEIVQSASSEETRQKITADLARGAPPDVSMISAKDLLWWTQSQALVDLGRFHPNEFDFQSDLIQAFKRGGKLYALPCGWSTLVLYYNKELFLKQGIPFPLTTWHWSDLLRAAESLTVIDDQGETQQFGLELDPELEAWAPFIWQNHGEIVRQDGSWCLTDPQYLQSNLQAIDFYAALSREFHAAVVDVNSKHAPFFDQKAAMAFGHRDLGRELTIKNRFDWDIVPLPRGETTASTLEVFGYAVCSQSAQPDMAYKLAQFLTRETVQAAMIQRGWYAPAHLVLFASKIFLDFPGADPANNRALLNSLSTARVPAYGSHIPQAFQIMREEMLSLLGDTNASSRVTLEQMQVRLEELNLLSHTVKNP